MPLSHEYRPSVRYAWIMPRTLDRAPVRSSRFDTLGIPPIRREHPTDQHCFPGRSPHHYRQRRWIIRNRRIHNRNIFGDMLSYGVTMLRPFSNGLRHPRFGRKGQNQIGAADGNKNDTRTLFVFAGMFFPLPAADLSVTGRGISRPERQGRALIANIVLQSMGKISRRYDPSQDTVVTSRRNKSPRFFRNGRRCSSYR